uniref:Uncharacterized protein n=1 Tax=viral metagenome TaxID=1070528 RepID=A0A6M3JIW0_9ZZZZ
MNDNFDRHIFLYAKGHYERTDMIKDLRIILGKRSGIEAIYINEDDIAYVLTKMVWRYINHEDEFINFLFDLNPNNTWKYGYVTNLHSPISDKNYVYREALISKCLSVLRFQKVINIPFDLGKADSNILPLNKECIYNKEEVI